MTRSALLSAVLGGAVLVIGCKEQPAATPTPPAAAPTQPATQPEPQPAPAGQPGTTPATPPVTGVIVVFRAERDVVTIRPGGEARVKLLSVPKDRDLLVSIEPPDSPLNAVVDRDVLSIRAGDEAKGESVITVRAGNESARVRVRVEPEEN
jgi:hypothetical protein